MVYVDDKVLIYMDLELPEQALTNGTIVYQYIQMIGEDETEGDDPYIGAGCQITVGEEESQKIDNYLGMNKLNEQQGKSVGDLAEEDKDLEEIFTESSLDWEW